MLGAIRHNGFIPWDDDIDIYMPREDYNRLLRLKTELNNENKDVVSIYTDEGYYLPFAKIVDLKTSIWEWKELPFLIGNYIDIFPLDCYSCSDAEIISTQKKAEILFHTYQATITKDTFLNGIAHVFKQQYGAAFRTFVSLFVKDREKHLANFLKYERTYTGKSGSKCVSQYQWIGKIFETKWFEDTEEVPFEDTTIVIPKNYDAYLSLLYGNWKVPPKEQKSNHEDIRYYLNLKERLTLEEISHRLKNGENYVL